jgi:hypothetical protein
VTERLVWTEDRAFTLADDAATVGRIARTVPAERLREVAFDSWTWLDLIGHVMDTAELFLMRVRRAAAEENPFVPDADTDALVEERRAARDVMDCARRIQAAHRELIALLQTPGVASRPVVHGALGQIDAGHLGAYHARHSADHVGALARAFPPLTGS